MGISRLSNSSGADEYLSASVRASMLIEQYADRVTVRAPAKVNLFLEVLAKRADGYHEIATLMVAVTLHDTLVFKEETSGNVLLQCNRPDLSTGPENLVCRAALLLRQRSGCTHGASIDLQKSIPLAAGLAGGSSDAAAALAGLNRLWRLGLTTPELVELSAELGSDVAFFFSTPAAWCTGRGEQVTPLPLGKPLTFVLVCPPVGLATADVYRQVTIPDQPETGAAIRRAVVRGEVEEIGRRLHNRLQFAAERICPQVAHYWEVLQGLGPAGQAMSGSGSALFALCRSQAEARRIARALSYGSEEERSPKVYLVRSCY
jgi:4-diphosphocytidyl-2-C-methyl-D-erythritol kinase